MAMARATRLRMESSSSAISTRGIEGPVLQAARALDTAAGEIALVEEAYIDIAAFGRRRGQPRLEPGLFPGLEYRLFQHGVPGVDLGALGVANAKAQPRQFDRFVGFANDDALD